MEAATDSAAERWGRAFVFGGISYLAAAVVIAAVHVNSPVTRGWWLFAFVSLVGGLSQLLLGPGLLAISSRSGAPAPPRRMLTAELVLWNAGTALVAVADLAPSFTGIVTGGMLLGLALLLLNADLRSVQQSGRRPARGWIRAYRALLWFLALSVLVGILLAYTRGR